MWELFYCFILYLIMYSEEILKIIYTTQNERFQDTRNNQWKINISFWTLCVLAISYKSKFNSVSDFWIFIVCILILMLHFLFIINIQKNLETSKRIWLKIIDFWDGSIQSEEFKLDIKNIKVSCKDFSAMGWFWIAFQIIISMILISLFYKIKNPHS